MAETTWFYQTSEDEKLGPVTTAQLQDLIAAGALPPATPVMAVGTGQWVGARMIPEFRKVAPPEQAAHRASAPDMRRPAFFEPPEIDYTEYQLEPHPWLRFFARSIDRSISLIPCMLALIAFSSPSGPAFPPLLLLASYYLVWVVVEARLLSQFGTTPGKSVLGIHIETNAGARPTFQQALRRSTLVFLYGEGLGIPVISLITQIVACQTLIGQRISTWDRDSELRVRHRDCGALRVCAVLFLTWLSAGTMALVAAEIAFVRNPRPRPSLAASRPVASPHRLAPLSAPVQPRHAYTAEIQDGRLIPFVDGADPRLKTLSGQWRDFHPFGQGSHNVLDVLELNPDGAFHQRLYAPDDHGRITMKSAPVAQWSGTWRLYGKTLTLDVAKSNTPSRPQGTWTFRLVELDPTGLQLAPAAFPPDFDRGPHPHAYWSYYREMPEMVQSQ